MNVDIDSRCPLTPRQIESFRVNGFIKLKDALSAETLAYHGNEITRLTIAPNTQTTPLAEKISADPCARRIL